MLTLTVLDFINQNGSIDKETQFDVWWYFRVC